MSQHISDENKGRVAIITGGSSGIGEGIAKYFHARGYTVAIMGRDAGRLATAAAGIGERCMTLTGDVSNKDDVFAAVKKVVDAHGKIDVLINNAGATAQILTTTPFEQADKIFREQIGTHLYGAFAMFMAVIPHMTRPGGRVINMSSIGSFNGGRRPGSPGYAAAKAGLNAMVMSWARELGPQGITVNGIAPGFIETALTKLWSEDRRRASISEIAIGRAGTPDDIAAAAYYLCSPQASFVTGEVLNVNGGGLFVH